jgi:hypothetical protein
MGGKIVQKLLFELLEYGSDKVKDYISKGAIRAGDDIEKIPQEDLLVIKNIRDQQILDATKNKTIVSPKEQTPQQPDDVDLFTNEMIQVEDGAPTVQVSLDLQDGKNSVARAIDRLTFGTSDSFHQGIREISPQLQDEYADIFYNIDQEIPLDYNLLKTKYLNSYEDQLATAKKSKFFNQQLFDKQYEMKEEYNKSVFNEFEALPTEVKKDLLLTGKNPFNDRDLSQNYATMPTSMKLAIYTGEMDVPIRHPNNDFFQNSYHQSIISNINQNASYLQSLIDQNIKAPSKYFPIQGKTAYAYEPERLLELEQREKMIGTLRDELKDLEKKINMMQEKGMEEAINSQQFASFKNIYGEKLKNYNNLLVDKWKPYIPDIRKGHETMIEARRTMYRGADEANLEQVKYPTFFTNDTRNRMHIKLEDHLMDYLDQLRNFKKTPSTRTSKKENIYGNTIRELEEKIAAIKKDMTTLGLPSRLYDPESKTFRLYGKAFDNPLQLYKSIRKKNKKLYYINTNLDKDPFTYSGKGTFESEGQVFLDGGFKDGGLVSFEEVLEYNNG